MFNDLFEARDKGRCSTLVMLDYSQAFDSIIHNLLLAKVRYLGLGDSAVSWVRSYLVDRLQVTRQGAKTSNSLVKARGVPQGSCLGPLLFTLYIADLNSCISSCTAHAYADDLQLHLSYDPELVPFAISKINDDLSSIHAWSVKHGLKLNASKCTVLHVTAPHLQQLVKECPVRVMLDGQSLVVSDTVKTLGVLLDSELSFTNHVTSACQRALGRLRGMYRFRTLLPEAAKLQLVQSIVLSVFYYCFPSYGNSIKKEDMNRIQKIQNTALRFVYNLRKRDHISAYRSTANMLPMETMCRAQTCCMVHKTLALREPLYLYERLSYREEVSQRETRQSENLNLPKVRLEIGKRGFSYFGPLLYNRLPCDLKSKPISSFKKNLKLYS